ncbi:MAG: glycosyltransferase [Comamonas sp.]|uniref:glycosyltransferase n=1 Tax=Comamonas sp. TaxID=34028 RepID=UPI002FC945ED
MILNDSKFSVSVLMSVYEKEQPAFLRQALQSLLEQVLQADQVVLVCDGPIPSSLDEVVAEFSRVMPLTIIRLPTNVGLARALNSGLQYCDSEWVARFDTDDICERNRFSKQIDFIKNNPDVDVLGSSIVEFESNPDEPYAMRKVKLTHAEIASAARFKNPMNHMTVIFRKNAVSGVGGYPFDELNEDYALWIKLIMNGYRMSNISEPLVRARAGRSMVSRRGGFNYFVTEFNMQKRILREGFISIWIFFYNVIVRFFVRLMPNYLRNILYKLFLRDKTI